MVSFRPYEELIPGKLYFNADSESTKLLFIEQYQEPTEQAIVECVRTTAQQLYEGRPSPQMNPLELMQGLDLAKIAGSMLEEKIREIPDEAIGEIIEGNEPMIAHLMKHIELPSYVKDGARRALNFSFGTVPLSVDAIRLADSVYGQGAYIGLLKAADTKVGFSLTPEGNLPARADVDFLLRCKTMYSDVVRVAFDAQRVNYDSIRIQPIIDILYQNLTTPENISQLHDSSDIQRIVAAGAAVENLRECLQDKDKAIGEIKQMLQKVGQSFLEDPIIIPKKKVRGKKKK